MKRARKEHAIRDTGEKGAVVVELALMLPLLVALLVTIVDMGLLLREHQIVENAAREGARLSSLPKNQVAPWNPDAAMSTVQERVVDYLAEEGITIDVTAVQLDQGHPVVVGGQTLTASAVTVTYQRTPLIGFVTSAPVTLSARAIFRNLY